MSARHSSCAEAVVEFLISLVFIGLGVLGIAMGWPGWVIFLLFIAGGVIFFYARSDGDHSGGWDWDLGDWF